MEGNGEICITWSYKIWTEPRLPGYVITNAAKAPRAYSSIYYYYAESIPSTSSRNWEELWSFSSPLDAPGLADNKHNSLSSPSL